MKKNKMLRKEYWGGLVYDREKHSVTDFLDHYEWDIISNLNAEPSANTNLNVKPNTSQEQQKNSETNNQGIEQLISKWTKKGLIVDGKVDADIIEVGKIEENVLSAPLRTYLHITYDCNLGCEHCMVSEMNEKYEPMTEEEIVKHVLVPLEEIGSPELRITGGEPTVRQDLFNIIAEAKLRDMYVEMNTNGVYNDKIRRKIVESGIDSLVISVDGDEKTHDAWRGKGRFNTTLNTIKYLTDADVKVVMNPTISRQNVHLVDYLIDLAVENNADINFMPLRPFGNGSKISEDMLSAREFMDFSKQVAELRETYSGQITVLQKNFDLFGCYSDSSSNYVPFDRSNCGAGTFGMGLLPNGAGNVCGFFVGIEEFDAPNVKEISLLDVWHSDVFQRFRSTPKSNCEPCNHYRKECVGACKAMSYAATGSIDGVDRYCFKNLLQREK